ncbi:uncharacterized protein METZ01_LOCUS505085, partial [marine metagenome]
MTSINLKINAIKLLAKLNTYGNNVCQCMFAYIANFLISNGPIIT